MCSVEQIAELDERIRKAKYELDRLQDKRNRMMKERWEFKKRLHEAEKWFLQRKAEKAAEMLTVPSE